MTLWYQPPPTLNRISPTLKLNSLRCTCNYNLSILNSKPTHIPELELEPIFASIKTFIPTTMANLGPSFNFLSCAVDSLGDFISLSIKLSVHPSKISITKISGDVARKISYDPLSNCTEIAAVEVMKMLEISPVGLSLSLLSASFLIWSKHRSTTSLPSEVGQPSKNAKLSQDVHFVPNLPMLEMTSSFRSTSYLHLLANLQPNRVHVKDGGGGVRVAD